MRWVSRLLSNNNDKEMRIGDIVTSEKTSFRILIPSGGLKVVTISPIRQAWLALLYHSYYTISANPIYMDPDYNSPLIY